MPAHDMVFLVPFDGSTLSKAALRRATEYASLTDDGVVALSVLPEDEAFARERGWVPPGEEYGPKATATRLEAEAAEVAPDVEFRWELAEDVSSVSTTTLDIVRTIRQVAHEVDARVVFVGSENAGRVSAPLASVGGPVSEDPRYDVHIVRHAEV